MKRTLKWAIMAAAAGIAAALAMSPILAQTDTPVGDNYTVPRTPWGDPDFQGIWTTDQFGQHVDLERPAALAGKFESTEEETEARKNGEADKNAGLDGSDAVGNYGREWRDTEFSKFKPSRRTSLIVDPQDGRVPFLPEARERIRAANQAERRFASAPRGPEDLNGGLRCMRGFPGVNLPIGYNNNKQIVQGPGYVAVLYEMAHETRLIPVNGRPRLGQRLRQVWGDPSGHWEGDTLVVETTNFSGKMAFQGSRENLRVVERFTRTSEGELDYQFTVEDPTLFATPFTVSMPWLRDDSQYEVFEYACHEGNYSMVNVLNAARVQEKQRAKTGR